MQRSRQTLEYHYWQQIFQLSMSFQVMVKVILKLSIHFYNIIAIKTKDCELCIKLYFTVSLLELFFIFCWHNTLRVMAKNKQFIYNTAIKIRYFYFQEEPTSIMATIGAINATIAPSLDVIQQLLYKAV